MLDAPHLSWPRGEGRPSSAFVPWPHWPDRWLRQRLQLRQALETDLPALAQLHEEGLRPYAEVFYRWDPRTFAGEFRPSEGRVLEWRSEVAGFYLIQSREDHLFLAELHVDSRLRNHGLGALLARCALAEAEAEALPLRLWVLRNNPARQLYLRLGFTDIGEGSCHHVMEHSGKSAGESGQIPARGPVLSPTRSALTPKRSSNETYRFVIGLPR